MQLTHFYHRHKLYLLSRYPDFSAFELATWLHTFAQALIWVFVPILLLQAGYSLQNILVYYLVFNLIDVPLNFSVSDLVRKIGARFAIIFATISIICFFLILGMISPGNWPLLMVLAVLAALYDTFFWVAHFYLFIETTRNIPDTGRSIGSLESVRKLANIFGPFLGAILLLVFGKPALIIASILIFALSIIPLFKMRHIHDVPKEKELTMKEFFSDKRERREYLSVALWGVHGEVELILWPLFIFTLFGTIESVALVPVIVSIMTALFTYLVGRLAKNYAFTMLIVGTLLMPVIWFMRISFEGSLLLYGTVFIMGFLALLVEIPIYQSIIKGGIEKGALAASTYRNTASMLLRIPLYATLLFLPHVFKGSFMFAALALLAILFVTLFFTSNRKL